MTASARARRVAVRAAAERIVTLLNEVEAGLRPARLVCPLFAVHLRGVLRRARPTPGPVADVHRLLICTSVEGTYEVVAVCRRGERFGAVGLRLSRGEDGWVVTDVAHPWISTERVMTLSDPPGRQPWSSRDRR